MFIILDHLRNHLHHVARNGIIGYLVDRSVRVGVDRDDHRRTVHAGRMLDLARNAAGYVELRPHGDARLSDLARMVGHAGIDRRARGAYLGPEHAGQLEQQIEILLAAHPVTAGHDDRSALDVDLALLDLAVDDADGEIGVAQVLLRIDLTDDAFAGRALSLSSSRPRGRSPSADGDRD